jgi:hypothetical protein
MGQAGTAEAIVLARQYPTLQIGWHLHLCDSQPLTVAAWPWGRSPARAGWAIGLSQRARDLMRGEVATQWERFRATGLACAFVNTHHHLHAHPVVYGALLAVLPGNFDGWLRLGSPRFFSQTTGAGLYEAAGDLWLRACRRRCPHRCSDTMWGLGRTYRMQAREVANAARHLRTGLHEFLFHPRTVDNDADLQCLLELKTCGF